LHHDPWSRKFHGIQSSQVHVSFRTVCFKQKWIDYNISKHIIKDDDEETKQSIWSLHPTFPSSRRNQTARPLEDIVSSHSQQKHFLHCCSQ
jgi:hypothetical protein